jgi:hypothetical protein
MPGSRVPVAKTPTTHRHDPRGPVMGVSGYQSPDRKCRGNNTPVEYYSMESAPRQQIQVQPYEKVAPASVVSAAHTRVMRPPMPQPSQKMRHVYQAYDRVAQESRSPAARRPVAREAAIGPQVLRNQAPSQLTRQSLRSNHSKGNQIQVPVYIHHGKKSI